MATNFIILSGGPGTYEPCDPEDHDTGWSNYVDNILLLASKKRLGLAPGEEVWWFVYKSAYETRWSDDVAKKRSAPEDIKKKGSTSYVNHLERRAKQYGWHLVWISGGKDFWKRLKTFRDKISRVWYFGHASGDLWLSLTHKKCKAWAPGDDERVYRTQIASNGTEKSRFQPGGSKYVADRASRFYGCNTSDFAQSFAKTFGVYTEGAKGKVSFKHTHSSGGKLSELHAGCSWLKYDPTGKKI